MLSVVFWVLCGLALLAVLVGCVSFTLFCVREWLGRRREQAAALAWLTFSFRQRERKNTVMQHMRDIAAAHRTDPPRDY
jgi:hypothetical protein